MTATLPRIGEVVEAKADPGDLILWSVTTVLSILDRPALIPWAVNLTADRVVTKFDVIRRRLEEEGPESASEYVRGLRWQTDGLVKAADLGTIAHHLFDTYALTGTRPPVTVDLHPERGKTLDPRDVRDLTLMLDQFDAFLQQFQPEYDATEVVVYTPEYGIAGQTDALMRIQGERLIVDYKTSRDSWTKADKPKGPYPEVGLQLAAYRHATHAAVWRARRYESMRRRYYLLSQAERDAAVAVPEVDGGVAIFVAPERFGVYPVQCGPDMYESFLYCLEVARWSFNESSRVVGNPMIPPTAWEPATT